MRFDAGQRAPDPEPFDRHQLWLRTEKLVSAFDRSRENGKIGAHRSRFLRPFLTMMYDLCFDLTTADPGEFSRDFASAVNYLPVWSQTTGSEAARHMQEELFAFFRFASRTETIKDAQAWLAFLMSFDLLERLEYTMQNDPRLQPKNSSGSLNKCRTRNTRKRNQKKRKRKKSRKCHHNG